MAAKTSKNGKKLGRPPLVQTVKRTTVHFDADDLKRFDVMRKVLAKIVPTHLSDQQLVRLLMSKGYEVFQREHNLNHELFPESSTTKP